MSDLQIALALFVPEHLQKARSHLVETAAASSPLFGAGRRTSRDRMLVRIQHSCGGDALCNAKRHEIRIHRPGKCSRRQGVGLNTEITVEDREGKGDSGCCVVPTSDWTITGMPGNDSLRDSCAECLSRGEAQEPLQLDMIVDDRK